MDQKRITLSAMTLRGIGSYAREARLDIRPITLLAGANGTGKSTWIKVINELVKAQEKSRLPFGLPYDLWNAYLLNYDEKEQPDELKWMDDKSLVPEYGFIGTIGLHGKVLENFKLPPLENVERPQSTEANDITSFFWHGSCSKGKEIRILISLPKARDTDYGQQVSVHVDKQPIFSFIQEKGQHFHTFLLNSQLLPESNSTHELVPVQGVSIDVRPWGDEFKLEGVRSKDASTRDLYNMALRRCTQLLTEMLGGFFYISPIREPVEQGQIEEACDNFYTANPSQNPLAQNRYVGKQGEDFPEVYYNYSLNHMDVINADTPIEDAGNRSYFLESYCGYWMQYLADVSPGYADTRLQKPAGFTVPRPSPDKDERKDRSRYHRGDNRIYRKYNHDCFPFGGGLEAEVAQLSSGFHQIAPLLLQGALLQRNETMLVENPEVHLHPSAQSKIMEYFVREAAVGKYFIIETHSDILVLRLLRAILSEELPQEYIRIYFTELVGDKDRPSDSFKWSQLKRIEIDDQGRIFDWPKGFMDQRMKEFDFIMNARFMQSTDDTEAT